MLFKTHLKTLHSKLSDSHKMGVSLPERSQNIWKTLMSFKYSYCVKWFATFCCPTECPSPVYFIPPELTAVGWVSAAELSRPAGLIILSTFGALKEEIRDQCLHTLTIQKFWKNECPLITRRHTGCGNSVSNYIFCRAYSHREQHLYYQIYISCITACEVALLELSSCI